MAQTFLQVLQGRRAAGKVRRRGVSYEPVRVELQDIKEL
jgi:hypothetical protein